VRAAARFVDVQKNTVLRVLRHAGRLRRNVMESKLMNLTLNYIQGDELVHHVAKKERDLTDADLQSGIFTGHAWIFLATDAETKLVPCFAISKRDSSTADRF